MQEVAARLRRWTAWHDEWEDEVGSLAVETDDGLVLIDPIDPPAAVSRPEHVLVTVFWHGRSTAAVEPAHVWASTGAVRTLGNRGIAVTDAFKPPAQIVGGIRAFATARRGEIVYWLPEQKAVVAGDVLLGAGAKPRATEEPLRLCPERWLGKATHQDLRESLRPLLDLPMQRVLPSHGEPVLRNGKRELAALLA